MSHRFPTPKTAVPAASHAASLGASHTASLGALSIPFLVASLLGLSALAAAASPPSPEALELRTEGIAHLENERPAEAEAVFRRLQKLVPADPLPGADLAIALLRQQQVEPALAAIDGALKLAPKRGDLAAIRAEILKWAGRGEEALAAYKEAAAAAPEDPEVVYGLYRHAESLRSPEAEPSLNLALDQLGRLRPDNLVVMLRLGSRAIAQGDRQGATRAWLRVRELLWQAPAVAVTALDKVLEALEGEDLAAARVPALRLENVLKITPMFQQGQRELTRGIQGVPVTRFTDEPPPGDFGKPAAVRFRAAAPLAPGAALAVTTGDFDGDEKADLAWIAGARVRLLEGGGGEPATGPAVPGTATALTAVDLDNDGILDLLAHGPAAMAWLRGSGDGTFREATAELGLGAAAGAVAVPFDYDIEGDLDLFTGGRATGSTAGGGRPELYRNNLQGPLEAVGDKSLPDLGRELARGGAITAAVASDLDRDGDLDLLLAHSGGLLWLDNLRQGEFRDRTRESGLGKAPGARALLSADFDQDGLPDLAVAGPGLTFWHNTGGRFEAWKLTHPVPAARPVAALALLDADGDGRLDLAVAGAEGIEILAARSGGRFEALPVEGDPGAVTGLAAGDLDGDGDLDLAAAGPAGLSRLTNDGGNGNRWLAVRLKGLDTGNSKNNLYGLGSVIEVRAGGAYQFREVTGDVTHFGLGTVGEVDVLRVVWTNGVPQNRLAPAGNQRVVEEQLLKGSCPFLYAWNGSEVSFVTDLLWGAPLGLPVAPGVWAGADPRELVAVPGARPKADGTYDLRITEELWEAAFFDQVRLWVVDAPVAVEVASSLKIVPGKVLPEEVLGARELRPVAAAWDGRGRDVTGRVAARDEIYADGYAPSPYQGVAKPWSFTFDLGQAPAGPVRLWLDGWIFPADASLNLAVAQRDDHPSLPPRLEVETAPDRWEVLLPSMGHPAGKTKTLVVDTPPLPAGARRLRITTSLWLSWDRIAWTVAPDDDAPQVVARLAPAAADLGYRGFSALVRQAPNAPHGYDYARVEPESPWLPFPGHYTRYGPVGELLTAADDRMVILAPGDELALRFDASALPPPAAGMHRTVFLESFGWDKDADRNTWEASRMEPLPFGAMSGYPWGAGESYPDTPETRDYRTRWLTRVVPHPVAREGQIAPARSMAATNRVQ